MFFNNVSIFSKRGVRNVLPTPGHSSCRSSRHPHLFIERTERLICIVYIKLRSQLKRCVHGKDRNAEVHNIHIHHRHILGYRPPPPASTAPSSPVCQYTPFSSMMPMTFAIVSALASLLPDFPLAPVYFVSTQPLFT